MAGFGHLVKRFLGSLLPIGPSRSDAVWALGQLTEGEQQIWTRLSAQDRRHAAGVARRVDEILGEDATRPVLAAALLHDCGKLVSGFGTFRRVLATIVVLTAGSDRVLSWHGARGRIRSRIADYHDHGRLGAELLGEAGSAPLTVAWAAEHHLPAERWSVPIPIGEVLRDADDD